MRFWVEIKKQSVAAHLLGSSKDQQLSSPSFCTCFYWHLETCLYCMVFLLFQYKQPKREGIYFSQFPRVQSIVLGPPGFRAVVRQNVVVVRTCSEGCRSPHGGQEAGHKKEIESCAKTTCGMDPSDFFPSTSPSQKLS